MSTPPLPSDRPAASLRQVGRERVPVLTIDRVTGDHHAVIGIAAGMTPFPTASVNAYPGLRRIIAPGDVAAATYVRSLLGRIAGVVNRAFGFDGFDLIEASFSIVTTDPARLNAQQRVPHFDAVDTRHLAILHYLNDLPGSGTAFFRQQASGIERVDAARLAAFVAAARTGGEGAHGYIDGSMRGFEEIGRVVSAPDRLVAYPGSLLHSGVIPPAMAMSDDPRLGRLTANLFVRGRPAASGR